MQLPGFGQSLTIDVGQSIFAFVGDNNLVSVLQNQNSMIIFSSRHRYLCVGRSYWDPFSEESMVDCRWFAVGNEGLRGSSPEC